MSFSVAAIAALGLGPGLALGAARKPDLTVSVLRATVRQREPGTHALRFAATIANRGVAAAPGSVMRFYLSTDRRLSSNDTRIPLLKVRTLRAGSSESVHKRWKVPPSLAPGNYHVLACADVRRGVTESNERNNCALAKRAVAVTQPGLRAMDVTDTMRPGEENNFVLARCSGSTPYAERGKNETVPKINAWLEWPATVLGWLAVDTVPYSFGSRAVTSYNIIVVRAVNGDNRAAKYVVGWSCTSDKNKAWLVFGF